MKNYLIQLNHPLLINNSRTEQPKYLTVYGFLAPYSEDSEEQNEKTEDNILDYLGYLAAIHEWSNNNAKEFDVILDDGEFMFVDITTGELHTNWKNKWCSRLGNKCRQKLNLDFKLYVIELDEGDGCYDCGISGSLITCDYYMFRLVREAEEQEDDREVTVFLYNRPLFLPDNLMWRDGVEANLVFGDVVSEDFDSYLLTGNTGYLGYLAMIEECYLNGKTPSGYEIMIVKDGPLFWRKGGDMYDLHDDKILEEGDICLKKNNQKVRAIIPNVRYGDIKYGIKGSLIVSKDLYEELLKIDRG